ncbi:MAG: hypothetical protein EXS36_12850 [Pedosphaera sp.]|nr:hypothetical protein [Pedosphaera sp.]
MSNPSAQSASGHRVILWMVTSIILLNLFLAWKFGLTDKPTTPTTPAVGVGPAGHPGATGSHEDKPSASPQVSTHAVAPSSTVVAVAADGKSAGTAVAGGNRVIGSVTLTGTPPAEKQITPITKDPNCGPQHSGPVMTRNYLVGANNGLANVFVYIKSGLEGKTFPPLTTPAVIDQKGCLYEPYVSGAVTGQPVDIKNSDNFMHNVNFAASTAGNQTFNFAQGTAGMVNTKTFGKPEIFAKIQCNVHPWMFVFIGVVAHPFFAVTDKNGTFELPAGLPAGDYVLELVHLKAGKVQIPLKTSPEGGATVTGVLLVQ